MSSRCVLDFPSSFEVCDITKQERIPPGEAFPSDWVGQYHYGMGSSRSIGSVRFR